METVCFEMAEYVSRTATTPILNQSNERNATVLDAHGRLAALSVGIPQFMLTSTLPVRFALEFLGVEEFREGDVFVANDPYHGGGHLPDYNVFAPVFADDGDGGRRMVLIASIQCHHGDTGGGVPGGYNITATDIWGEGVRWPVVKVIDRGVERRDVLYALQVNNRIPCYIGDLRAQIGSAQLGAQRLGEIIDRYGAATVEASVDSMIDYAARRFREEVDASGPTACYEADAYVDHDPLGNPDVHLHVKITVAGDTLTIDFTGSDIAARDPGVVDVRQHARVHGRPDRRDDGSRDPEERRLLRADQPRRAEGLRAQPGRRAGRCRAGRTIRAPTSARSSRSRCSTCSPTRAVPQTYKTGIPTIITGIDPRTGASFTDHSAEVYAGWCNASKGMDAWGALNASFGNLWKATAEINESLYPHVQWSRDYRTDSGGPGQWRGICGSHYEKEVLRRRQGLHVRRRHEVPDAGDLRRRERRAERDDHPLRLRRPVPRRSTPPTGCRSHAGRAHHVRLRRRRRLGRSARPRPASRARRRARRVRVGRGRAPRLRRRAHRLARRPHARARRRPRPSSSAPSAARESRA